MIDNGIKAVSDMFNPETYKKIGKMVVDTFSQ
jgi:hypothetical protein